MKISSGILLTAVLVGAASAAPRIEFDRTVYDFGRTSQGQSTNGYFVVRNRGDANLVLGHLTTSCGCTEAVAETQEIPPGGQGKIKFTLTMPSARRMVNTEIVVESNDPALPSATLIVKTDFVPLFEIQPLLARFELSQNQSTNLSFVVRRTDGKPLAFKRMESTKPWLLAKLVADPGASDGRLVVTATPGAPPRYLTEVVNLFVADSEEPDAKAVLMGRVLGRFVSIPEALTWTKGKPRNGGEAADRNRATRKAQIKLTSPAVSFKIKRVESSLPDLVLKTEVSRTNSYELVAELPDVSGDVLAGNITVVAEVDGKEERLNIPVRLDTLQNFGAP